MKKCEASISFNGKERLVDVDTLLKQIFWKTNSATGGENNWLAAKSMLAEIRDGTFQARDFRKYMARFALTFTRYYSIIWRLKSVGMIYSKDGQYFLSDAFALRCEEMSGIWRAFSKKA